jgi:beta-lactamase class A
LIRKPGTHFAWRGEERFPLASTFKFILAAAILAEVDAGRESLDRRVPIAASDMVEHAPVTEKQIGAGLTVKELCQATIVWSDNPAANLLLPVVGGPAGLTRFARNMGDQQFRRTGSRPRSGRANRAIRGTRPLRWPWWVPWSGCSLVMCSRLRREAC